ncbi:hypothetical protein BGZ99_001339 [Dissophora globulifera]|uniref:Vacuolar import and degradation protein n=1 Tax=Dissophora globulifera TaxID=979702 RepID=A0A9P6UWY5_9FUNG|nr:hypothetical protein BGZ99_001339 [Dissophora globulifera]
MPVFTQTCSADPVADSTVVLVAPTCTCGCLSDTDMILLDSDGVDLASSSPAPWDNDPAHGLFIHINGVRHWAICALNTSLTSVHHGHADKNKLALLKQQQQQKLIGGLALLRKPPVSTLTVRTDPFAPARIQPTRTGHLYAGSRFRGKQRSGTSSYEVMVDIKDVNLKDSSICGYLHINGLTVDYPELTTFFDAEIIGNAHSFVTKKWDADVKTDKEHWTMFKQFESMSETFSEEKFKYDFKGQDVIFMRWKEHFLVPDHRVDAIVGASFAGFYYICYNKLTGEIDGFYFHRSSEKFQKLTLTHIADRSVSFGSYEFR